METEVLRSEVPSVAKAPAAFNVVRPHGAKVERWKADILTYPDHGRARETFAELKRITADAESGEDEANNSGIHVVFRFEGYLWQMT